MFNEMLLFKRIGIAVGAVFALVMLFSSLNNMFETNNAGFYQVKQAVMTGELSVRTEPGTYWQGWGTITTYMLSDEYYFSKHGSDAGTKEEDGPVKVRFNDGGTASISGVIKFRLSSAPKDQLLLHNDFKTYVSVKHSLIRQVVTEAVQQTANLMRAEESYSTRRSEFAALAEEQVIRGVYETVGIVQRLKDTEGNEFVDTSVNLKYDHGKPVVRKASPLPRYNIEVLQFVIKDIDFDDTIENLINKKKEAEQQKVVARANAEKAKQDAITAREQGEARIAEAKANEEVKKIQSVVQAQKDLEVATLSRKRAEQDANAMLLKREAEAKANLLLVKAGLTPLERATIDKETAIGVAEHLAKVQLPSVFIAGQTGAHGGSTDPFTAIGLNQLIDLSKKMSRPTVKSATGGSSAE